MCGGGLRICIKESNAFFTRATSISDSVICRDQTPPRSMHIAGVQHDAFEHLVTVTLADVERNIGLYQDEALRMPVVITENNRPCTALISAKEYARLKRRDRQVIAAGGVSERQVAAMREARVPDRFDDLDAELKDWEP